MSKRAPISKLTHLKLGTGNKPIPEDSHKKAVHENHGEIDTVAIVDTSEDKNMKQDNFTSHMNHQTSDNSIDKEKLENNHNDVQPKDEWSFPVPGENNFTKKITNSETNNTAARSNRLNLPKFLEQNKIIQSVTNSIDEEIKMLPFSNSQNPNSFSSIFSRDHEEITGIRRVFRKSVIFLALHLLSLLTLVWCGLNLLTLNPIITLLSFVTFVAVTNLFYIIVADRSYVSLSLAGLGIGLLLIYSFLGQAFNPVSLIGVSIILLLAYIAYSEIEKIQLGSRLFTISNIVGSSTRILTGAATLILSLGLFNQMLSEGSSKFLNRTILSNPIVLEKLIIGEGFPVSLNRLAMNGASLYSTLETNTTKATFKDFLTTNYTRGEDVVSKSEEPEIIIACENAKGSGKCGNAIADERNVRLEKYRASNYTQLPYTLETVLNKENFREISKQYYLNIITEFDKGSNIIIPRAFLLPGIFATILYLALSLLSPLFALLVQTITWIGWQIMKTSGFAKIEVETVESEVVSI